MDASTRPQSAYEQEAGAELARWRERQVKPPGPWDRATRELQDSINRIIPEKVHAAVTVAIEQLTRGVMLGSDWVTAKPLMGPDLAEREAKVRQRVKAYRVGAAAEGGVAGAGGFLMAAADFPALMALKIKLLFDIAALYGHDPKDARERLFILTVFQLAFSSPRHRAKVFRDLELWQVRAEGLPADFEGFDWRAFQQEYRDYIDLAKLAQLIPVVGAPIGAVVNWRLVDRLGETAMNAYRLRWFDEN
jgi:hypothetical protein